MAPGSFEGRSGGTRTTATAALAKTLLEIEVDGEAMPVRLLATHLASRHETPEPVDEIRVSPAMLAPLAAQPHLLAGDVNALLCPGDPVADPPARPCLVNVGRWQRRGYTTDEVPSCEARDDVACKLDDRAAESPNRRRVA